MSKLLDKLERIQMILDTGGWTEEMECVDEGNEILDLLNECIEEVRAMQEPLNHTTPLHLN